MRILKWFFGKSEKPKKKQSETMPNFKKIFALLPKIINATIIPDDTKTQDVPSVQDRAAAKSVAEKEAKTATSNEKMKDVYIRIQTAESKSLEIIWLLQTNEDVPYKSVRELIESYKNVKDSDSYRGISVNYASEGKLREISPLNEQDLDGLAKKLEG